MKKYWIISGLMFLLMVFGTIYIQEKRIEYLDAEVNRHKSNSEQLLGRLEKFKVSDSLNAATVRALRLELSEYERFREADAELIKELQGKNRDLQSVVTAQTETISEIRSNVRDSVVYLPGDTVKVIVRCIDVVTPWTELHGCSTPDGRFTGKLVNRDSILITESVQYKKFLWWKTKKVKNRDFRIISKNPHTKIMGFEVVTIEK